MTEKYFMPPFLFCFNTTQHVLAVAYFKYHCSQSVQQRFPETNYQNTPDKDNHNNMTPHPQVQRLRGREVCQLHCY